MTNLNDKQIEAINDNSNVVLVIAGAGSGKTTVLTERVKKLVISDNVNPRNILAITFTNKATKEMKERLSSILKDRAKGLGIYTFHALSVLIIRENIKFLGNYNHQFNIIDEDDKKKILSAIIKDNNYEIKVNEVKYTISHAKAFAKNKKDVEELIYDNDISHIFKLYQKYLADNNAFDFDDLLLYAYELLKIPEVQNKYQNRYSYIHVDEFQDTSAIQADMLRLLKSPTAKLFIVGDVDQSIYEWRGATIDNIMNISNVYDDTRIIKLEQNYRSSKNILDTANSLIEYNKNRFEKTLWTDKAKGQKINAYRFKNDSEQADFIKKEVKYLEDFGTSLDEIAILYRFNYQSKRIEEALIRSNIAYKIYGGLRFYDRMEVKDVLAYLRVMTNTNDNISFLRIINVPKRKVGEQAISSIREFSDNNGVSYFDAALTIGNSSLKAFCKLILKYQILIKENFKDNFKQFLIDINYEAYLLRYDDRETVDERMLNIEQVYYSISDALDSGVELLDYLNELVLFTDTDDNLTHDAVVLSTVHGVKGLEFDNVFLVGLNETIFPKKEASDNELEEERRVMYVAITRARTKLTLTNYSFNYTGNFLEDSRFIEEMGIDAIEEINGNSGFTIF